MICCRMHLNARLSPIMTTSHSTSHLISSYVDPTCVTVTISSSSTFVLGLLGSYSSCRSVQLVKQVRLVLSGSTYSSYIIQQAGEEGTDGMMDTNIPGTTEKFGHTWFCNKELNCFSRQLNVALQEILLNVFKTARSHVNINSSSKFNSHLKKHSSINIIYK